MRRRPSLALPLASAALFLMACGALVAAANHAQHSQTRQKEEARAVCELCGKPIVAGPAVNLDSHQSSHSYACVHCALLAARDWVTGDVTITARSGHGDGKIQWRRQKGEWTVSPASAVVLSLPETGGDCRQEHLAFRDQGEFRAYGRGHPQARGEQPFPAADIGGILTAGRPPRPKEAVCPVSGKRIHPVDNTMWTVYRGTVYYFCCDGCKPRFVSNPDSYIRPHATAPGKGAKIAGCKGANAACGEHGAGSCEHSELPANRDASAGKMPPHSH